MKLGVRAASGDLGDPAGGRVLDPALRAGTPSIQIAPTLAVMAGIYRLSRRAGPKSERFQAYLARVREDWGLVAYNPMAGQAALDAVERLLVLDAESIARIAATAMAAACGHDDEITLAVVVRSPGMWTDRVATDADYRAWAGRHPVGFGVVNMWSGEPLATHDVRREAAVETVRVMWSSRHGHATAVREVLAREGLAYALTTCVEGIADPFGGPPTASDVHAVEGALDVLGSTSEPSDVIAVLLGDEVSTTMGWTPLGVPEYAGYRWAIDRSARLVADLGPVGALRADPDHQP